MSTVIILATTVFAVVALAAALKAAVRSDGYGRRDRAPSSRWPDAFDPPAWHSPRL
ncbi:MAG TPA: hypothetical protein VLK34_06425 [Nocardioidaceae bacterium]|nr:hypothetical protein [Nocardioidaceae bacterium]